MENRKAILRERFFNMLLAMFFAIPAYAHAKYFYSTGSLPTLIFLVFEVLLVFLALSRNFPKEVSFSFKEWLAAAVGSFLPIFLLSNRGEFSGDFVFFALQLVGATISLFGMFSLNLSYGVVPANRGVRKAGLYKFVRHPIYAGYFVSLSCFVVQNAPDADTLIRNLSILLITLVALVFRIRFEERFLQKDAEYQKLMQATKYRLCPGVW